MRWYSFIETLIPRWVTHLYDHWFSREIVCDPDMAGVAYARVCKHCGEYEWASDWEHCQKVWHDNPDRRTLDAVNIEMRSRFPHRRRRP